MGGQVTLRAAGTGCLRVSYSDADPDDTTGGMADFNAVWEGLREAAQDESVPVRFGVVRWAGPNDFYLAVLQDAGVGVAAGLATEGLVALIKRFVRKNPERPVTVILQDNRSYTFAAGVEVPPEVAVEVEQFARENATPPSEVQEPPRSAVNGTFAQPDELEWTPPS